jgi:type IV secretory pathway VirD2 relaxase
VGRRQPLEYRQPRAHVIVRGIDEDGHDVTIDGRYLSEGMRSRAQTILTNELGPRTEVEVQSQLAREVGQERFTSLTSGPTWLALVLHPLPQLQVRGGRPSDSPAPPRRRRLGAGGRDQTIRQGAS